MNRLGKAMTVDDWDLRLTDMHAGLEVTLHPDDRNRFWADPFLSSRGDVVKIFCEEFDYRTNRGTVVELLLDEDLRVRDVLPMLHTGVHESYPFVFDAGGVLCCIPETADLGHVALYSQASSGWERAAVLLPSFPGLDTTLHVDASGHFWLFSTPDYSPHELHLWHSAAIEGPWLPHRLNPVLRSPRGGRQAGRVRNEDGRTIRPGQNSTDRYGGSIVEFEILELTPDCYRETEYRERLAPPGYVGIHTIDETDRFRVIDAARRVSVFGDPAFAAWRLKKAVGRL